jgi:hypothetical protein
MLLKVLQLNLKTAQSNSEILIGLQSFHVEAKHFWQQCNYMFAILRCMSTCVSSHANNHPDKKKTCTSN